MTHWSIDCSGFTKMSEKKKQLKGLIALEENSFFQASKKIKICHCDQKPGAIALFVDTKICTAPNKVRRGRQLPLKQAKLIQILKNNRRMR